MKTINAQEALALVEKFKLLERILEPIYGYIRDTATLGARTTTCYCSEEHRDLLAARLRSDGFDVRLGVYDDRMGLPLIISW